MVSCANIVIYQTNFVSRVKQDTVQIDVYIFLNMYKGIVRTGFKLHTVFSNRIKISSPKSLSFQSKILRNAAFYKTSVVRSQYVKHSCYDIKNYSYNIN